MKDGLPSYVLRNWKPRHKGVPPYPVSHVIIPASAPPRLDPMAAARQERHTISAHHSGIPPTPPATRPRPNKLSLAPRGTVPTPPARLPDGAESVYRRHRGLFEAVATVLFIAVAALIYSKSPRYR